VSENRTIPTPINVRWQRLQYQIIPVMAVVLCAAVAWRLWHDAPRANGIGQVNAESADARSPAAGTLVDLGPAKQPHLFDSVVAGQVIARVEREGGKPVDVTAPISGQIMTVRHTAGETVRSGQTLMTIAADRGKYITAYVRSGDRVHPEPGMAVDVRSASDPSKVYQTWVDRIGPQYEPVPPQQQRSKKSEEWGLPVMIVVPPDATLRPGELVYVGWRTGAPAAGVEDAGGAQ
jgi:hypothetical protein